MTQAEIIRDLVSTARDIGKTLAELGPLGFATTKRYCEMKDFGRLLMDRANDAEQAAKLSLQEAGR